MVAGQWQHAQAADFTFHGLLDHAAMTELPLFSDLGDDVFIPTPLKEYPLTHFLEIADAEQP